jgi:hypothetical protein
MLYFTGLREPIEAITGVYRAIAEDAIAAD